MSATFCSKCGTRLAPNAAGALACPQCDVASFAGGAPPPPATGPAIPPPTVTPPPPINPPPPPVQPPPYGAPPPPYARPYAPPPPPPGKPNEFQQRAVQVLNYSKRFSLNWMQQARKAMAKHVRDIPVSTDEQDQLAANGIADPAVQRHFAWRRSLLMFIIAPTAFTALFGTIGNFSEGVENLSAFGVLMMLLYTASLWAIPVCSFLAARVWHRPATSRKILLVGFLGAFLMIILLGLLPFGWWLKFEVPDDPQARKLIAQSVALLGGVAMMMTMLPAVLSLLPGAIRACVRIKVLFPESIVSGWLLITVAPLYALFLLTIFVAVNQVAGSFILIFGVAAMVAAPVTYLVRTPLFIRPLWRDEDREPIARAQWVYLVALGVAGGLLMLYALTGKFMGEPLVGSAGSAVIGYGTFFWHVIKFVVDYIGRSLFITAIAMDYFLQINVSVWKNMKAFERTEHAAEYERTIEELGGSLVADAFSARPGNAFPVQPTSPPPPPAS